MNETCFPYWLSAAQIAAMRLPGLPHTKRKINAKAVELRWRDRADENGHVLAKSRTGRGGGMIYHWTVLPAEARAEMLRRGVIKPDIPSSPPFGSRLARWWRGL